MLSMDADDRHTFFGIPYRFDPPSLREVLAAYWQPGESMLVEKPFGIGYSLNLANWRSWVAIGVVAALAALEDRSGEDEQVDTDAEETAADDGPVEVLVE
jgi:hypothetical protein